MNIGALCYPFGGAPSCLVGKRLLGWWRQQLCGLYRYINPGLGGATLFAENRTPFFSPAECVRKLRRNP